jgi:hypothetical protein
MAHPQHRRDQVALFMGGASSTKIHAPVNQSLIAWS